MNATPQITMAGWLLRAPQAAAERCREGADLREVVQISLLAIAIGGAAFGAVVGSFRGGQQIFWAALKMPLAVLAALALCVPAFHAFAAVFGRPWRLSTVLAITLAAAGRASLLLLAFTPALWLAYDLGLGYHAAALVAAGAYATSGLAALGVLVRGLGPGRGRSFTILFFAAVFLAAGGQTSWMLRPYLVRPQSETVPLLRARESVFVEALFTASRSAAGIYERPAAPRPTTDATPPPRRGEPNGSKRAPAASSPEAGEPLEGDAWRGERAAPGRGWDAPPDLEGEASDAPPQRAAPGRGREATP